MLHSTHEQCDQILKTFTTLAILWAYFGSLPNLVFANFVFWFLGKLFIGQLIIV